MTDRRPTLAGWPVPQLSTVVWVTVAASVMSYFVFSRAVANLVAIVGGIVVTVIAVKHDRFSGRASKDD